MRIESIIFTNEKVLEGDNCKPRKHEQRLLRNVGVHNIVLDLLQIPFHEKEDTRMHELMKLAHEFLQNFCLGNAQNQIILHQQLELFLNPGVSFLAVRIVTYSRLKLSHSSL